MKLLFSALAKLIFGFAIIGAMLFLPAWTFNYPNAWLFMAILFVPMMIFGAVLFAKAPKLLKKRLSAKEKESTQRGVVALSGIMFPIGFIISALDFRYGWSQVPTFAVILSASLFLIGYIAYAEVMRENEYLSRTVEVTEGQVVISGGLYAIVRHPMYLATLLMFIPIPIILGSFWGLIPFALYPLIIVIRILNEEKLLEKELDGYIEYKKKTRYRLIPFIW